eukprot:m.168688 g.168688  ORF g.168688 m.168688 type:complete len:69 (+) comp10356_c0_seq5:1176-1382(+)
MAERLDREITLEPMLRGSQGSNMDESVFFVSCQQYQHALPIHTTTRIKRRDSINKTIEKNATACSHMQ